jgi:hypothetical protein
MNLPYLACMLATAQFYQLPPRVLPSIQAVEGGFAGAIHPNKDGSDDLGVMQVNTVWVQAIARHAHMSAEDVQTRLVADDCFNIAAAGLILRTYMNETRGDLMAAIGDYHSHTPALNRAYQAKVWASAAALFGGDPR